MHVAIVQVDIHIPQSRSLKDKRAAVKPIVEGLRQRFHLSAAEVGYQDKWQRALLGFAVVSETFGRAEVVVGAVERWVWSRPDVEISSFRARWSTFEEDADGR